MNKTLAQIHQVDVTKAGLEDFGKHGNLWIYVYKREFAWESPQLSCPGQTRTRVAWELTSESLHESFINSQCPGQTRTRVAWELTSESLHESFINSRVLVKREQELHWELTSESLHESFINSHVLVKREQELHESWQARVWQARVCMRVSSTLVSWSNENKSCRSKINKWLNIGHFSSFR